MKKYLNLLGILGAILALFILSELIYVKYNDSTILNYYYMERAKISARSDNAQEAIDFLVKGAELVIKSNSRSPDSIIPENYSATITLPNEKVFQDQINSYLSNLEYSKLARQKKYNYSRVFYDLSLLSLNEKQDYLFPQFVEISYYFDPLLSYWVVELSNFYYKNDETDKAMNMLEKCMTITLTSKHCQETLSYFKNGNEPFQPGFLAEAVDEIFELNSQLQ